MFTRFGDIDCGQPPRLGGGREKGANDRSPHQPTYKTRAAPHITQII